MHQFDQNLAGSIDIAQTEAINRRNPTLEPIHLLYGLFNNPHTSSHKLLKNFKKKIEEKLDQLPVVDRSSFRPENLRPSTAFAQLITQASADVIQSGRQEISEPDILKYLDAQLPGFDLNNIVRENLQEEKKEFDFLINLNELARQGKLDPVIGRTKEIRAVMESLDDAPKITRCLSVKPESAKPLLLRGLPDLLSLEKYPTRYATKKFTALIWVCLWRAPSSAANLKNVLRKWYSS